MAAGGEWAQEQQYFWTVDARGVYSVYTVDICWYLHIKTNSIHTISICHLLFILAICLDIYGYLIYTIEIWYIYIYMHVHILWTFDFVYCNIIYIWYYAYIVNITYIYIYYWHTLAAVEHPAAHVPRADVSTWFLPNKDSIAWTVLWCWGSQSDQQKWPGIQ